MSVQYESPHGRDVKPYISTLPPFSPLCHLLLCKQRQPGRRRDTYTHHCAALFGVSLLQWRRQHGHLCIRPTAACRDINIGNCVLLPLCVLVTFRSAGDHPPPHPAHVPPLQPRKVEHEYEIGDIIGRYVLRIFACLCKFPELHGCDLTHTRACTHCRQPVTEAPLVL